jgi:hypothetical protein
VLYQIVPKVIMMYWQTGMLITYHVVIEYAAPYCAHLPEHPHAELISSTMIKTVIAVAQGIGALYPLVASLFQVTYNGSTYVNLFGVDTIFTPVAVFGLLRLFAARWLTEDYIYTQRSDIRIKALPSATKDEPSITEYLMSPRSASPVEVIARYRPTSYWPSRVFRTVYILILVLFWAVNALYIIPIDSRANAGAGKTVTMFMSTILYFFLLSGSVLIILYYFARGRGTTTIIPCISSPFYRLYSYCFFLGCLGVIVIASIETNRNPGGGYTSVNWGNMTACDSYLQAIGVRGINVIGITGIVDPDYPPNMEPSFTSNTSDASYYTWNFTGYCSGHMV